MSHFVPAPLPKPAHLRVFDIDSIYGDLDEEVVVTQRQHRALMKDWEAKYNTTTTSLLKTSIWRNPRLEKKWADW